MKSRIFIVELSLFKFVSAFGDLKKLAAYSFFFVREELFSSLLLTARWRKFQFQWTGP